MQRERERERELCTILQYQLSQLWSIHVYSGIILVAILNFLFCESPNEK